MTGNGGEPVGSPEKDDILEEAWVVQIVMVMRRRMFEWFGHVRQ